MTKTEREHVLTGKTKIKHMSMVELGLWFGYPPCCIIAFTQMEHIKDGVRIIRPLEGTGYIPCARCCAVSDEETMRTEIALSRVCPVPFPDGELYEAS